uniref:Serpin 5 n=1 Tax=Psoroptes ovis TaxID=83912 RepID=A0A8F2FA42_PSOOV|nr:serpin 5 [Psoroptes ovis]
MSNMTTTTTATAKANNTLIEILIYNDNETIPPPITTTTTTMNSINSNVANKFLLNLTKSLFNNGVQNQNESTTIKNNLFLCTYSLKLLLSILIIGSDGNTRDELSKLLYSISNDNNRQIDKFIQEILSQKHGQFLSRYKDVIQYSLSMYYRNDLRLCKNFMKNVSEKFRAQIMHLDLFDSKQLKKAIDMINNDICKQTDGRIKHIVNDLDPNVLLLLIDTIHFKDIWQKQFDTAKTSMEHFFIDDHKTIDTMMMHQTGIFDYCHYDQLSLSAILLPYNSNNHHLSMLILLPSSDHDNDKLTPIQKLLNEINDHHLSEIMKELRSMAPQKIELTLPRFKIESSHEHLIEHLKQLGLRQIFDQCNSNLMPMLESSDIFKTTNTQQEQCSNICVQNPKLFVSKIIQKAMIEVNEQGTEACAVTKVSIRSKRSAEFVEEMNCNRPFMFMIVDESDQPFEVLFTGVLMNPAA